MPRRLKIASLEMGGELELYLIYSYADVWEEQWRALQKVVELDLPEVSKETMDQALIGWTRPLVEKLGPEPKGRLRLLPKVARECANKATCPLFDPARCGALLKNMPWCFEPAGLEEKALAAEVIKLWREEVYVVIVQED